MVTIDQLDQLYDDNLELRKENARYKVQLTACLLNQSTTVLSAEQSRNLKTEIRILSRWMSVNDSKISENNKIISEINNAESTINIEKQRQITADKQKDAAIEKYRAERGETTCSPMLFIFIR